MPSYQVVEDSSKIHPYSSLLKTGQSQFPQHFLLCHVLQSPNPLGGLLLDSPIYISVCFFLYWGMPNRIQHSRCAVGTAEQRGRISSLNQLVTPLLIQPKMLSAFFAARAYRWLMFSLVSTGTSGPSLQSWFLASQPSACTGAWVIPIIIPPQVQDFALSFVES